MSRSRRSYHTCLRVLLEQTTDPKFLVMLDMVIGGMYHQVVVRRLVQLEWSCGALGMLDKTCDAETFELVLFALPTNIRTNEFMDALKKMKALGYKRSTALLERATLHCPEKFLFDLFLEIKDIDSTAEFYSQFYYRLFNDRTISIERCEMVLKEVKHKGLDLDSFRKSASSRVDSLLKTLQSDRSESDRSESQIRGAVNLLVEVGEADSIQMAYDVIFKKLVAVDWGIKDIATLKSTLLLFKSLGYNRSSIHVFEAEIYCCTTSKEKLALFQEMKDQCDAAASWGCYKHLVKHCQSFKDVIEVVQEAMRKHISVDFSVDFPEVAEKVARLLKTEADVHEAAMVVKEVGKDADEILCSIIEDRINLYLAALLFEAVVKDNLGVPFPYATDVFFGRCSAAPQHVIEKCANVMPWVLHSLYLLKNPEVLQSAVAFLNKCGKGAQACQHQRSMARNKAGGHNF